MAVNNVKSFSMPLSKVHKFCMCNEGIIKQSKLCGCFYCGRIFSPDEVMDYMEEHGKKDRTASCPYCYIDSVIGDASGIEITEDLLNVMHQRYFT